MYTHTLLTFINLSTTGWFRVRAIGRFHRTSNFLTAHTHTHTRSDVPTPSHPVSPKKGLKFSNNKKRCRFADQPANFFSTLRQQQSGRKPGYDSNSGNPQSKHGGDIEYNMPGHGTIELCFVWWINCFSWGNNTKGCIFIYLHATPPPPPGLNKLHNLNIRFLLRLLLLLLLLLLPPSLPPSLTAHRANGAYNTPLTL